VKEIEVFEISYPYDDSRIFPALIGIELPTFLRGKRYILLWRGSRDGFGAREFHRRCDGRPNTLTMILDTAGNIFGGFTPLEWESGAEEPKADPDGGSFLFTLKNMYKVPPTAFPLKAEKRNRAIFCAAEKGPCFGDMSVMDNCNRVPSWACYLGENYANVTGVGGGLPTADESHYDHAQLSIGNRLLSGGPSFLVKEIEVFESIT
jgi:hypothetical protein